MTQGIFRKLFPKSMIFSKIWNFVNSGNDPGEFPETFSRYWKKFPEKPLSHDPFLGKNIFSWVSTHEIYLEIVSGKSPESRPKIAKSGKAWKKFPGYPLSHRPFFGNSFRDLPIWVNWIVFLTNLPLTHNTISMRVEIRGNNELLWTLECGVF